MDKRVFIGGHKLLIYSVFIFILKPTDAKLLETFYLYLHLNTIYKKCDKKDWVTKMCKLALWFTWQWRKKWKGFFFNSIFCWVLVSLKSDGWSTFFKPITWSMVPMKRPIIKRIQILEHLKHLTCLCEN